MSYFPFIWPALDTFSTNVCWLMPEYDRTMVSPSPKGQGDSQSFGCQLFQLITQRWWLAATLNSATEQKNTPLFQTN